MTKLKAMTADDVPSPIDLRLMRDAREWEQTVMAKRPWRRDFFAHMGNEIAAATPPVKRILELGSGPGFLAEYLLKTFIEASPSAARFPPSTRRGHVRRTCVRTEAQGDVSYVMLDFSAAMHELARARLGELGRHAEFL